MVHKIHDKCSFGMVMLSSLLCKFLCFQVVEPISSSSNGEADKKVEPICLSSDGESNKEDHKCNSPLRSLDCTICRNEMFLLSEVHCHPFVPGIGVCTECYNHVIKARFTKVFISSRFLMLCNHQIEHLLLACGISYNK